MRQGWRGVMDWEPQSRLGPRPWEGIEGGRLMQPVKSGPMQRGPYWPPFWVFLFMEKKFSLSKSLRTKHKTYKLIHPPVVFSLTSVPQTLLATHCLPSVPLLDPHCLTEEHLYKPQQLVKTLDSWFWEATHPIWLKLLSSWDRELHQKQKLGENGGIIRERNSEGKIVFNPVINS